MNKLRLLQKKRKKAIQLLKQRKMSITGIATACKTTRATIYKWQKVIKNNENGLITRSMGRPEKVANVGPLLKIIFKKRMNRKIYYNGRRGIEQIHKQLARKGYHYQIDSLRKILKKYGYIPRYGYVTDTCCWYWAKKVKRK